MKKPKYYSNLRSASPNKLSINIPEDKNLSNAPREPKIKKEADILENESMQLISEYDATSGNDEYSSAAEARDDESSNKVLFFFNFNFIFLIVI